jgi:hypothetical protein
VPWLLIIDTLKTMILHFLLASAFATSFYIPPFSDFTREADLIARGQLNNIHAVKFINDEGTEVIYTYAALEVKDLIKGKVDGHTVQVRKVGGTKDGVSLEIPGSPEFHESQDTVLFLGLEKEDHSREVQSLELGQYGTHETEGQTQLTGGIFNYSKPSDQNQALAQVENLKVWTLADLKALVARQGDKTFPNFDQAHLKATPASLVPAVPSQPPSLNSPSALSHEPPRREDSSANLSEKAIYLVLGFALLGALIFFFRKR